MSISTLLRAARGERSCGAVAEKLARPLPDFEDLSLSSVSRSGVVPHSLANQVPSYAPLDQGPTGSCFAQALCLGEVVAMKARHGVDVPMPSRRAAYYWARYVSGDGITDDGCRASDLLRGAQKYGLPPETSFPWSKLRIDQRPPTSARWDAGNRVGKRSGFQIYYGRLEDRITALQSAIRSGRPFIVTIPVGDTFDACRSAATVEWPKSSTVRGFHALLGLSCSDVGLVEIINSWGGDFGVNGMAWLAPEYLERSRSIVVLDPELAAQ